MREIISQEEFDAIEAKDLAAKNQMIFLDRCPRLYQESDLSRFNQDAVKKTMGWTMGARGLLLIGTTGCGKTRTVWQLIRKLMCEKDIRPVYVKATALGTELYESYTSNGAKFGETPKEIVRKYKNCRVLVIDDFAKEPFTPRYTALLYEIIDGRREAGRPCIITTNLNSKQMIEKIGDDTVSKPLIHRVREMCESVVFDKR